MMVPLVDKDYYYQSILHTHLVIGRGEVSRRSARNTEVETLERWSLFVGGVFIHDMIKGHL